MHVLFAMPFPPPHYAVSIFLTSIVAIYLLQRCCTLRAVKRFSIAGLLLVSLIIFHFVWFWIEYPDRHVAQLIDCTIQFIPVGLVGAILGLFLGTFRLHQTPKNEGKRDETHPHAP